MTYINGGEGPPEDEDEDDGDELLDQVGQNPTGRKRRSSARTRRKRDNRLFKGTIWERKKP